MPRITVEPDSPHGPINLTTFNERIVAENLASAHYRAQLIERIAWATADAEALESDVDAETPTLTEAQSDDRADGESGAAG